MQHISEIQKLLHQEDYTGLDLLLKKRDDNGIPDGFNLTREFFHAVEQYAAHRNAIGLRILLAVRDNNNEPVVNLNYISKEGISAFHFALNIKLATLSSIGSQENLSLMKVMFSVKRADGKPALDLVKLNAARPRDSRPFLFSAAELGLPVFFAMFNVQNADGIKLNVNEIWTTPTESLTLMDWANHIQLAYGIHDFAHLIKSRNGRPSTHASFNSTHLAYLRIQSTMNNNIHAFIKAYHHYMNTEYQNDIGSFKAEKLALKIAHHYRAQQDSINAVKYLTLAMKHSHEHKTLDPQETKVLLDARIKDPKFAWFLSACPKAQPYGNVIAHPTLIARSITANDEDEEDFGIQLAIIEASASCQFLEISDTTLSEARTHRLFHLLAALPALKEVKFENTSITDEEALNWATTLNLLRTKPTLTLVDNKKMTEKGIEDVNKALALKQPSNQMRSSQH